MAESDQSAALLSQLSHLLGAILGRDSGEPVHADRGFFDQGMDSIKALEFREAIGETLGIHLEASDIFDYPTPKALCNYILVGIENVNEPRSIDDEPMEIQPDIAALSDSDLAKLIDAEYESSQANRV
jgi:acyl carrier protein